VERNEQLLEHIDQVRELYASCRGNLVRVHEELVSNDVTVAYSTLTGF